MHQLRVRSILQIPLQGDSVTGSFGGRSIRSIVDLRTVEQMGKPCGLHLFGLPLRLIAAMQGAIGRRLHLFGAAVAGLAGLTKIDHFTHDPSLLVIPLAAIAFGVLILPQPISPRLVFPRLATQTRRFQFARIGGGACGLDPAIRIFLTNPCALQRQ